MTPSSNRNEILDVANLTAAGKGGQGDVIGPAEVGRAEAFFVDSVPVSSLGPRGFAPDSAIRRRAGPCADSSTR